MSKGALFRHDLAILFLIAIGGIHFISAYDCLQEALYKTVLFYANGAGATLAIFGICAQKPWGWLLGFLIAAGSLAGYIASRTIGLPLIPPEPDAWFEPLGVVSVVAELAFIILFYLKKK